MLSNFFKSYRPILTIFIIVYSIFWAIWKYSGITVPQFNKEELLPLHQLIEFLLGKSITGRLILSTLIIIICAFYLNHFNNKNIFIPYRTYVPALFFTLIVSTLPGIHQLSPVLLTAPLLLVLLNRIILLSRNDILLYHSFEAGIITGIATLIYLPSLFFLIVIYTSLIVFRPFVWREWIYPLLGFSIPIFICFSIYFLGSLEAPFLKHIIIFNWKQEDIKLLFHSKAFLIYAAVLLIFSSLFMVRVYSTLKIFARKSFIVLFVFFLIGGLILLAEKDSAIIIIMTIPAIYPLSYHFIQLKKKWYSELLSWLWLTGSILCAIYN